MEIKMLYNVFPGLITSAYYNGPDETPRYKVWSEFQSEPGDWKVYYSAHGDMGAQVMRDNVNDMIFVFSPYVVTRRQLHGMKHTKRADAVLVLMTKRYKQDIVEAFVSELTEPALRRLAYLYDMKAYEEGYIRSSTLDIPLMAWDLLVTPRRLSELGNDIARYYKAGAY
jgi:hypothetical protein